MDRELAKDEIKRQWKAFYPKDQKKGIICPLCGSGSGPHGTGITEDLKRPGQLHCFSCGFDGDILALIQQERGLDFRAALEYAAAVLNITLDDLQPARPRTALASAHEDKQAEDVPNLDTRSTEPIAAASADPEKQRDYSSYYHDCEARITEPEAASYLRKRGISIETAQRCRLGYDPLSDPAESGHKTPRIIIPVTTAHYIARSIDPTTPKAYSKMNNKGAEIGIYDPMNALYQAGTTFITEGAIDALSIMEAGGKAIALNSTSNAELLLRRLADKPTSATLLLCLDNDEAGRKATETLETGLSKLNICYQCVTAEICGDSKDPNERLTSHGIGNLSDAVKSASARSERPDNTRFYLESLMQGEIEKFRAGRDRKTGFENLDRLAGGLYSGLYVLAAISSLGKTSFALQIADQIAAAGTDVIFFSLEQSRLELVSKSLSRIIYQNDPTHAVTALKIRQGYIFDETLDAIEDYKATIQDRLSIVEGNFACTVAYIRDYTRQYMQRTNTKPVVFIDYLQILQGETDKRQTSKELIDGTVTELKRMSRDLDITVFVISSLNRMNYLTPISFEALKESGSIEYSADVIYGLQLNCINQDDPFGKEGKSKEKHRIIQEHKAKNPREIELVCLKNRYGVSSFSCKFDYYPANDCFRPAYESTAPKTKRL